MERGEESSGEDETNEGILSDASVGSEEVSNGEEGNEKKVEGEDRGVLEENECVSDEESEDRIKVSREISINSAE